LRENLSGDPLEVIHWYLFERPCLSLQWTAIRRLDSYPALARRAEVVSLAGLIATGAAREILALADRRVESYYFFELLIRQGG
jgi:hypothetical protein